LQKKIGKKSEKNEKGLLTVRTGPAYNPPIERGRRAAGDTLLPSGNPKRAANATL
jgi:hypothetical protein